MIVRVCLEMSSHSVDGQPVDRAGGLHERRRRLEVIDVLDQFFNKIQKLLVGGEEVRSHPPSRPAEPHDRSFLRRRISEVQRIALSIREKIREMITVSKEGKR